MKHFNKTTKNMTLTQKFDYIKKHFTYWTMNSWNKDESIANNIKIYNLPLTREQQDRAYEIICDENLCNELWQDYLATYIYNFKRVHHDYFEIYSNGGNGGYLVLNGLEGCRVINEDIEYAESYKELVNRFKDIYGWAYVDAQREARQEIEDTFDLIVDFDNTCDDMLNEFIYVLDCVDIKTKTYTKEYTCKTFGDNED